MKKGSLIIRNYIRRNKVIKNLKWEKYEIIAGTPVEVAYYFLPFIFCLDVIHNESDAVRAGKSRRVFVLEETLDKDGWRSLKEKFLEEKIEFEIIQEEDLPELLKRIFQELKQESLIREIELAQARVK